MASALTAMRFAIHGGEVSVPKLEGMVPPAAETTANDDGLVMVIDNKFYSDTVPEGRIVSQSPPVGKIVRRGWSVHVAISLGKRRVNVPNVVGESQRAAEINLRRRGLEVNSVAVIEADGVPPGQVLAQDPPSLSASVTSPKVNLLVSSASEQSYYVMPSFLGKHYADASEQITEVGFNLGKINVIANAPNLTPPGIILKQSPVAGAKILQGSTISFDITR